MNADAKKPDGGAAFPRALPAGEFPPEDCLRIIEQHAGMSMREYYAAHAPAMTEQWFKDSGGERHWLEAEAAWRFAYADAMIAEGSK